MHFCKALSVLPVLLGYALAHPGHDIREEILERRNFVNAVARADLSHCADNLAARGVVKRNIARRQALLKEARVKRE